MNTKHWSSIVILWFFAGFMVCWPLPMYAQEAGPVGGLVPKTMDVNVRVKEITLPEIPPMEIPDPPKSAVWLGAAAVSAFHVGTPEEAISSADVIAEAYSQRFLARSVLVGAPTPAEAATVGHHGDWLQKMRFRVALREARRESGLTMEERVAITRVITNPDHLEEFMVRFAEMPQIVGAPGDWIDDISALIEIIIQYLPQIIELILIIIAL